MFSADAAAAAAEYEALVETLSTLQQIYFSSVAALAWLVFDILITLGEEFEFIWKARWTVPKLLYIAARYYGLFNLAYYINVSLSSTVSAHIVQCVVTSLLSLPVCSCRAWIWFDGFSNSVFFTTTVNLLFVIRIHALYEKKKSILAALLFLFFAEFIIEVVCTVLTVRAVNVNERTPGLPILGCSSSTVPHWTLMSWIPCLIVACVFYGLTIYKLAKNVNIDNWFNFAVVSTRLRAYPVMEVFYRDGSLFFGMIFVVILLNTVFNVLGGTYLVIGAPWLSATYSVAGSRLVLNLRSMRAPDARLDMRSFSAGTFKAAPDASNDTERDSIPMQPLRGLRTLDTIDIRFN